MVIPIVDLLSEYVKHQPASQVKAIQKRHTQRRTTPSLSLSCSLLALRQNKRQ